MSNSASDEEDAERWAIRLDNGPLGDEEQSMLDAWLAADERRRGALLRAEAVLAYLDRGRALGEQPDDATPEELSGNDAIQRPAFSRRAFMVGGSIGGLAAAAVLGFILAHPQPLRIETAMGEVRRVPLADGSVASVNTGSKMAVEMAGKQRQIDLQDGEAWFQVAPDKTRPFVVVAGDVRVRAVGTAFAVRKRGKGADVLVTEGVVEVWVVEREEERTRIAAGSKSFVAAAMPAIQVTKASGEIDRALAWRTGELALNGESLDYAAAELNRYNVRKLVIDDPKLGREPLVGYFRTDQPENFGRTVANMLDAKVVVEGDTIHLSR